MFTESDRVTIRLYMGAGSIYLQLFPKLENAITAIQSIADGGVRSDNSTELMVRTQITNIQNIETRIQDLYDELEIKTAGQDKVELDVTKAVLMLQREGRRYIGNISRILACAPVFDYFSSQAPSADDFANIYSVL